MDKGSDLINLVAVGDICLGLGIRDTIRQFGPDFPFSQCSPILQNADLVFGNLEMVFYGKETPLKENRLDFKVPLDYGEGLGRAGFRVLSVANNHILDFGSAACRDTLYFLKGQGIQAVGCGKNLHEARKPAILTIKGKRIGFLAYAEDVGQSAGSNRHGGTRSVRQGGTEPYSVTDGWSCLVQGTKNSFRARRSPSGIRGESGCMVVAPIKRKYILEDIRSLRQQVDLIVVSLHADLEFSAYPAPWRVRLSRQLIDAGADLILQHHPHVPQGVERYGGGMIMYSLGSFVFPVYGNSYAKNRPHMDQSFILRVWMSRAQMSHGKVAGAEFLPLRINRFNQPVPLVGEEAGEERQKFLMYLQAISAPLQNIEFLDRFWAMNCRRSLRVHWSWLKEAYWDTGWSAVLHRLVFLARTSGNRRWLLGLVPGLVRFGFSSRAPENIRDEFTPG